MGHNGTLFVKNGAVWGNRFAPLICRVVRAWRERGRWAWIPGGGLRYAPFSTPNLRSINIAWRDGDDNLLEEQYFKGQKARQIAADMTRRAFLAP